MTMTALRLAAKVVAWLAPVPGSEPGGPSGKGTEGILGRPGREAAVLREVKKGARRRPGSSPQGRTGQTAGGRPSMQTGVSGRVRSGGSVGAVPEGHRAVSRARLGAAEVGRWVRQSRRRGFGGPIRPG